MGRAMPRALRRLPRIGKFSLYIADIYSTPQRIFRVYRTDWPKEQPEYGYGEKFMPKAKLEKLMLEYAKKYIANYEANSKF